MADDLRDWNAPPQLSDVVEILDAQLERGQQFYAMQCDEHWLVFYNGPRLIH